MSKETAMAALTGTTPLDVPRETIQTDQSPGLAVVDAPKELDSSRFANLAKKEAKVVADREAYKAERAQFEAEREKLREVQKQISDFEALRKADPVSALKGIGFTETDIFNFLSASEKKELTPEEQAKKVAQEVVDNYAKTEQEKQEKARGERDAKIIEKFKGDITAQLKAGSEKYWRLAKQGEVGEYLIYQSIQNEAENMKEGDTLSSIEEVMQQLEDQYKWEYEQMLAEEKKRSPQAQVAVDQAVENNKVDEVAAKAVVQKPKTITSNATATIASTTVKKKETSSEKRERLMNILRNGG